MTGKFLIVNNEFLMSSSVHYHHEIVPANIVEPVIFGGGYFYISTNDGKVFIYGESHQYKKATKETIISALEYTFHSDKMMSEPFNGYRFYISERNLLFDALLDCSSMEKPDWTYE